MSVPLMRYVWSIRGLSMAEKLVLLKMADYATDDGTKIHPKQTTLAEQCGCDVRTVRKAIDTLIDADVLVITSMKPGKTTVYKINPAKLAEAAEAQRLAAPSSKSVTRRSAKVSPDRVAKVSPDRVAKVSLPIENEPLIEPLIEPEKETPDGDFDNMPPVPVVPSFAEHWPVLHVKNGDYTIKEPYASDMRIKAAIIEWLTWRVVDKKKGMPTVFAMERNNCGWWDRYALDAVVEACEKAAGQRWQGIIEDVARNWKPQPGSQSSKTVQHSMQSFAEQVRARQDMIRRGAGIGSATQALPERT